VVYISKKDLEIRTWPEESLWTPSQTIIRGLKKKAKKMSKTLSTAGPMDSPGDIPFDPCGCWLCEREQQDGDDNE